MSITRFPLIPHSYRLLLYNPFSLSDNKLPENVLSQEILTLNEPVSFVLYGRCIQGSFYVSTVDKHTQFLNLNMFLDERFIHFISHKNKQTTLFIF